MEEDDFEILEDCDDQTILDGDRKKAAKISREAKEVFGKGNLLKAIELWTEAIELAPKDYQLYNNRSLAYMNGCVKNYREALYDGKKAISLRPDLAQGYCRKGKALVNLHRWTEAGETFEKGLEIDPNNQQLKVELAYARIMGCLPQTYNDMKKEAMNLGLSFTNPQLNTPRKKLIYFAWSSSNIQRSFTDASLLLVGSSGAGKSSTVNHLFKNKNEHPIAETHETESQTRHTIEYKLQSDSPKLNVNDLTLSVVDTPGFNDTRGLKQDTCNFFSIKEFYDSHPIFRGFKPNLIFVLVQATDTRISGPNSNLAKSLRCISKLNLVDRDNPNVVGILTWSCAYPRKKYREQIDRRKEALTNIIFHSLNVLAPIVAIENDFEAHDLEEKGHFTILPDGEMQLKNLYNVCEKLLSKNHDKLGLAIFNACFLNVDKVSIGHKVQAKDSRSYDLSTEEKDFCENLEKEAVGENKNTLVIKAQTFIEEEKLSEIDSKEVRSCVEELFKLGIETKDDLRSVKPGYIGVAISEPCKNFLKKLQIETKGVTINSSSVIGQGYNITKDEIVPNQIFETEMKDSGYGVCIPAMANLESVNEIRSHMDIFKDYAAMAENRMRQLNIGTTTNCNQFEFKTRAGASVDGSFLGIKYSRDPSFLLELRLFELKITDFNEPNLRLSEAFQHDVKNLPDSFDEKDKASKKAFEDFFRKWGHFIVVGAFCGGSIENKISDNMIKQEFMKLDDLGTYVNITYNSILHPRLNTSGERKEVTKEVTKTRRILKASNTKSVGGDPALETCVDEQLIKWKKSLIEHPSMLETEMKLLPISVAIGSFDKKKADSCLCAVENILGGQFKQTISQEELNEGKGEAETRENTVKDPTSGKCFPSSAKVSVLQGNEVKENHINNIFVGDLVLVWNMKSKRIMFSPVIMFAHFKNLASEEYLCITLANGKQIKLSENHLIMVGREEKMVMADQVKIGDLLSLDNKEKIKVVNIKKELERGIFCPITHEGTIFVNNILASCYASVSNYELFNGKHKMSGHNLAHLGLLPMRIWYKKNTERRVNKNNKIENKYISEIHPYINFLCKLKLPWMSKA